MCDNFYFKMSCLVFNVMIIKYIDVSIYLLNELRDFFHAFVYSFQTFTQNGVHRFRTFLGVQEMIFLIHMNKMFFRTD